MNRYEHHIPLTERLTRFEGLGNNCEFGVVQREAGLDPPGLFRNVGFLQTEQMIGAIAASFDGMFDAGAYEFSTPDTWPDYALDCKRFGFRFHTGIKPLRDHDFAPDFARCIGLFRYLKAKFLNDLRDGEKIFAYRHVEEGGDGVLARRLLRAMRHHGPGWLLYIRQDSRAERAAGWAEPSGEGLIFGGIVKLSNENPPQIDFAAWDRITCLAIDIREAAEGNAVMNAAPARYAADELGQARALRSAGWLQEADRVLRDAVECFPDDAAICIERALIAQQQSDWREAVERWQTVRDRFPDEISGDTGAGHALRHLRRCDEADAITEAGLQRRPGDHELLVSHAWTAMVRQDFAQAERRWWTVLAQHPRSGHGYIGLAEAFRHQDRKRDVDAILRDGMSALPDNEAIAAAFAMAATQRREWALAVERWRETLGRLPGSEVGHLQLGIALKQLGEVDAAEAVLADGTRLVPGDLALAMEHAWCAVARNDWPEALRRWEALGERFAGDVAIQEGLVTARLGLAEHDGRRAPADAGRLPSEAAATDTDGRAALLRRFESLGENCEFGLVQRHFGIEPISLFRWVSIGIESLVDALDHGLEGVGSAEQTILGLSEGREYFVSDTKYKFGMHTFVQEETVPQAQFFDQQCRRFRYLGRQFLDGLSANEKIYVYCQNTDLDDAQLLRLQAALQRYGNVTLLQVRQCDAAHAAGTVEHAREGLLIGYIERFGKTPWAGWDIAYDCWLTICRAADELRVA